MDDLNNLRDLRLTIDSAIEVLAAVIGLARGQEPIPESLAQAADQIASELARWRAALERLDCH